MSELAAYDAGWREWLRLVKEGARARRRGFSAVAAQVDRKAARQSDANTLLLEMAIQANHKPRA